MTIAKQAPAESEEAILRAYAAEGGDAGLDEALKGILQERVISPLFGGRSLNFSLGDGSGVSVTVLDRENLEQVHSKAATSPAPGLTEEEVEAERKEWGGKGYFLDFAFSAEQDDDRPVTMSRNLPLGEMAATLVHEAMHEFAFKGMPTHDNYDNPLFPEAWQVEEAAVEYATNRLVTRLARALPKGSVLRTELERYRKEAPEWEKLEREYSKRIRKAKTDGEREAAALEFRERIAAEHAESYHSFLEQIKEDEPERIIPYVIWRGAYSESRGKRAFASIWKSCGGDPVAYGAVAGGCLSFPELDKSIGRA